MELFKLTDIIRLDIPLFASTLKCGFPSPADDHVEGDIDLNRNLIKNRDATFYTRAASDSMEPLIFSESLPEINDRAVKTGHGAINLAYVAGDF